MRLKHITFTGIDAKTDIKSLQEIQKEYPIAEFGVLTSYHWYENGNRYPDLREMKPWLKYHGLNLALHLCGSAAHDAACGSYDDIHFLTYGMYPYFQRIQLNIANRSDNPKQVAAADYGQEIIVQQRDIESLTLFNDTLEKWKPYLGDVSVLLDASGGQGIDMPIKVLPNAGKPFKVGYTGGFNPENVSDKLHYLLTNDEVGDFWIDMESGVRTEDDWFDLDKVRRVLAICNEVIRDLHIEEDV